MLDRYLEGLVKEAKKQERTETLSYLDMDDLAKVAGIRASSSMCPKCGEAMTKTAGYLRCTCGVLKVAGIEEEALGAPGGGGVPLQVVHRTSVAPITAGEASGERKGRRVGALAGMGLGGAAGLVGAPLAVRQLGIEKEMLLSRGREAAFMDRYPKASRMPSKLAPAEAKIVGRVAENRLPEALHLLPKSRLGRVALGAGGALGAGALLAGLGGGVGRMVGGEVGQTIGGGVSPTTTKTSAVACPGSKIRSKGKGRGKGFGKAKGPIGIPIGDKSKLKTSSLLEVGDAAGRILAKMAAAPAEIEGVPVEELKESIEEAKSREDVPGRAKRWSIGSGIGGGLAGGAAGYGLGHLLTRGKSGAFPWLARIGGTALGGAAGGAGGAFLGHRHGAEEAEADQLLESIRARNAFGTGAQTGYHQGAQSGYLSALEEMNQGQGGDPFQGR